MTSRGRLLSHTTFSSHAKNMLNSTSYTCLLRMCISLFRHACRSNGDGMPCSAATMRSDTNCLKSVIVASLAAPEAWPDTTGRDGGTTMVPAPDGGVDNACRSRRS